MDPMGMIGKSKHQPFFANHPVGGRNLHHWIGSLSHYLQGLIHFSWYSISAINRKFPVVNVLIDLGEEVVPPEFSREIRPT